MNGTEVKSSVEHLSSILDSYLSDDLDTFSYDKIASTISSLEIFSNTNAVNDDLHTLRGLVTNLISHLYVARGYAASPDVPRPLEYYERMGSARQIIQQIKQFN